MYYLDVRRPACIGSRVHLALITLAPKSNNPFFLGFLNDDMGRLLHVLRSTLQRGDVISCYSGAQFVLLLPSSNYEDSEMILERILPNFRKVAQKQELSVAFKLQQLECTI